MASVVLMIYKNNEKIAKLLIFIFFLNLKKKHEHFLCLTIGFAGLNPGSGSTGWLKWWNVSPIRASLMSRIFAII